VNLALLVPAVFLSTCSEIEVSDAGFCVPDVPHVIQSTVSETEETEITVANYVPIQE